MTGPLAQIITLTSYGNDYLLNDRLKPNFFDNLSFKFCNKVDFRVFKRPILFIKQKEKLIAGYPNDWFKYLKNDGCKKMRLYFKSSADQSFAKDYKLAGLVGGGGTWLIEVVYSSHSNVWANRWEVTQKDDADQKIWSVNYAQTQSNLSTMDLQISQQRCKEELEHTLAEVESFAFEQKLEYWGK